MVRFTVIALALLLASGMGAQLSQGRTHKLVAAPGLLDETTPGVQRIAEYGSYRVYRITDEALHALEQSTRESLRLADDMDVIHLDAYPLDTRQPDVHVPSHLAAPSSREAALHLVQFVGPIKEAWLEELRRLRVRPVQYIESNAYLVWAGGAERDELDRLAAKGDFLQYSGSYHPYFKLGPTLREPLSKPITEDRLVPVTIQVLDHEGKQASRRHIESVSASIDSGWDSVLSFENVQATVPLSRVAEIASLPDVTWIGERLAITMMDEAQDLIVAAHLNGARTGPSEPGYKAFLDGKGFSTDPGAYPVVVVVDDGVGNGLVAGGAGDPTFTKLGDGVTTRLAFAGNCTSYSSAGGVGGHGHINTSIVGGYDTRTGSPYQDTRGFQRGMGVNPYGRMAMQKIFNDSGVFDESACGGTDAGVISTTYGAGARISSNSWGCTSCAGTYDTYSQAYDAGTRDAMPATAGNQELLFVFAAGNSGPGASTIATPGNGKNIITVGASENYRPDWTDGCGTGPSGADNAMDVIGFSSRGPSPGGRRKPEVIAPGTHIQGTASTNDGYIGASVCDQYRPSGQTVFAASSGTSHSTPAAAGVASLYYRWLEDHDLQAVPSPALIKAYMMTHTTYLTGASANDTLPSNSQGYGMPNLEMAFDNTKRYLLDQSVVLDNSGSAWTFHGSVDDPTRPVRVSMVYTDAPGALGTSPQVNNLDLSVSVNGTTYLGNVFSGPYSVTGGSPDNADNYEAVFLPAGTDGGLTLTVTGFNVAGDGVPNHGDGTDQDFAIVCYNCNSCSGTMILNRSVYNCSGTVGITLADYDLVGAGSQNVTLRSATEPSPETAVLTETPAHSGIFVGTLPTFGGSPVSGDGRISVANGDTITVRYVDAFHCEDRDVVLEKTAAVDCVGPAISNVQAVNVTGNHADVTWTTNEPATSRVTYDTTTPPGAGNASRPQLVTSHTVALDGLVPCTQYYYYVGSTDAAGNSSTDATGGTYDTFTTGVNNMATHDSTDVPKSIPDNSTVTSTLAVTDNKTITDLDVNIGNITHTHDGDLEISITGPDGTTVILSNARGSGGDNYVNTVFDDEAATPVSAGTAPFTGSFRPEQALTAFDGKSALGTWTLTIRDLSSMDTGALQGWGLAFTYTPRPCNSPGPIILESSSHADTCGVPGGGGSNGHVEPGENSVVQIMARNDGTAPVTNVTGTLSTTTPGITITDGTATFPDMLPSQSRTSQPNHFSYLVGPNVPCRTLIDFNIAFTSSQGSWSASFTKSVGDTGTIPGPPTTYGSTDVPKTVTDNTTVTSNSPAAADTQPIADVDVTIGSLTHPYDGDLTLTLIHPDGTRVPLSKGRGSSGDNFTNTVFDDEAATPISSGAAPFTGSWTPDGALSGMDTKPANGVWKLEVADISSIDSGTLSGWSMTQRTGTLNSWSLTLRTFPFICSACPVTNTPAEASNLRWTAGNKDQLDWSAAAGATGYKIYRGVAAGLPSLLNGNTDSCTRSTTTAASSGHILMEPSPPSPVLYWYIVTGVNSAGEGPAGTATQGTRIVNSSGPCP